MSECKDCKFFRPHQKDDEYGDCKRRAPSPAHYGDNLAAQLLYDIHYKVFGGHTETSRDMDLESHLPHWACWPTVTTWDECGEFEIKETPVNVEEV